MNKDAQNGETDPIHHLPDDTQQNNSGRSIRIRWLQLLAVILLVCLLGGGFVIIQVLRSPRPAPTITTTTQRNQGWCVSQGAGFSTNSGTPSLQNITAISSADAWAVGSTANQPIIEHWNGNSWNMVASPQLSSKNNALYGVTAISKSDVWAVGTVASGTGLPGSLLSSDPSLGTQPLIEHWNGQQWSIVSSSAIDPSLFSGLLSISAVASNDIWAVGATATKTENPSFAPLLEHWDGSHWNLVNLPVTLSHSVLTSVAAISSQDVWAAGTDDSDPGQRQPIFIHWNGQQWSTVKGVPLGSQGGQLTSISADTTNDVWAVGLTNLHTAGTPLIEHWNGTDWKRVTVPLSGADDSFLGIRALSPENVWIAGYKLANAQAQAPTPLIEYWDGQKWTVMPQQRQASGTLSNLASAGKNTWSVGTSLTGIQQVPYPLIETNC